MSDSAQKPKSKAEAGDSSGPVHWADFTADRIIKQTGDKESYVCASGITPSGVVHFGNFRETITVDFVVRALKDRGKKVRFIFSWDDYDTFRKVPKNMPKQEELEKFLFNPIVDTPDPYGCHDSYAGHHEHSFLAQLDQVGIKPSPLFQAKKYRAGEYREQIKKALDHTKEIVAILNKYRAEPLPDSWLPVLLYCANCNRDRIENITYDGQWSLSYECDLCHHKGVEDLKTTTQAKLPWRVDWPMRWAYEQVDFEPGGKDHSSEGGSFTTAKDIVTLFGWKAPAYLQYDFVSIKGGGGKMSSSSGEVVTVNDVLKVYEPEMVRWIFASYKPNVDFAVSFDLDAIKAYEDFDKMERLAYGVEDAGEKKNAMARRVYELSQIGERPTQCPIQPSFRHLCNILQINEGNIDKARSFYAQDIKNERDERRFRERSERALFWLENYAPEDFKFRVNTQAPAMELAANEKGLLQSLATYLSSEYKEEMTERELHEKLYGLIHEAQVEPKRAFEVLYGLLISKTKGPKLAGFIQTIGKEKVYQLLTSVL